MRRKCDIGIADWDRQGNLLSDGSLSYVYDGFCRVSEVETAEGGTQKNRYDAEGLRHEMEENGQLVQFLYADREVIAETQSDGNVIRYIRGLGLISSDSEKAKTYYHYVSDEQGSITHVTEGESKEADESQTEHKILNRYRYDAFGNTTDCEETVANRFRYLGEQHDPITQQYYLRARYYNPVIGRFTQEDTYYGDGLNLYQYCAGNPVRYCDPSGHGSVEQNPYKRYTDVGADADTAALAGQAYPDAASKQSLYNKYKNMGYTAENATMLANYEIIHGTAKAEAYAKNVPKTGTDRTQTSPRDNYSTDWRSQNRANQQRGDGGSNTLPDPYALLRERGIPQTLTDAEINAANQAGLRMMAGESGTPSNKVLGGSFKDVDASRGANEVGHHLPQNAYNVNELGMTRNEGPALLMTKEDHALTRTYRGRGKQTMISDKGLNARQRMVLDIISIRENFGTKYNEGLLDAIKYAKTLPQFQK